MRIKGLQQLLEQHKRDRQKTYQYLSKHETYKYRKHKDRYAVILHQFEALSFYSCFDSVVLLSSCDLEFPRSSLLHLQ